MTRILVLTNQYPPHHLGGYELSCRDVVDRWRRKGHDVHVLTGNWRREGVEDPPGQEHVARELDIWFRPGRIWSPPVRTRLAIQRRNEQVLERALELRPDVISIWHMGAMSTGLLQIVADRGIPSVMVICDDWPTYAFTMDPWMRLWSKGMGRVLAPAASRVLKVVTTVADLDRLGPACFVSDTTRRRCRRHSSWRFPDSTVTFSGIDPVDFPVRGEAAGRPEWHGRLLAVGRLDPRKGFETAIRALALLPAATLDIYYAADDPYRDRLESLVTQLGLGGRVRLGSAERSDLKAVYSTADALLFTPEWDEPFGLVPVEAMACATPVVTTATGGSGEFLVDGTNCLVVPKADPAALAGAVGRLAGDPELRAKLVAGGTATARELDVDRLAAVLEEWHLAAGSGFADGRPADRSLGPSTGEPL